MPQRHLPAAVLYKDLEKRKRERQKARHEDGRATDAKQARMRGHATAVCVESASPSPTHGEQPGENVVQANPPFAGMPVAQSGNNDKILHAHPDTTVAQDGDNPQAVRKPRPWSSRKFVFDTTSCQYHRVCLGR